MREFLGHGAFSQDDTYELQTIIDNVYLLTPELLSEIGQLVVESGHAVARKSLASRSYSCSHCGSPRVPVFL